MSDIQVRIMPTEVKKIEFEAPSKVFANQPLNLEVGTNTKVLLNMAEPLMALVEIEFTVTAKEDEKFRLITHTVTGVTVSSFIDNLDDVIMKQYAPSIILASYEKFKQVASVTGINLRLPNMTFPYNG